MRCAIIRSLGVLGFYGNYLLAQAVWPFSPKRFTSDSLVSTGSLGLASDGRVVAFGDLDGDQFMDILMVGADQQTVTSYLWHHDTFTFRQAGSFKHTQKIHNIVPGDFSNKGRLDLLIMSEDRRQSELSMSVYFSDMQHGFLPSPISIPTSTNLQPIVVDANGDMKMDLLGTTPQNPGDERPSLRLWKNVWNETKDRSPLFELSEPMFKHGNDSICKLSQPHSNAFLDFDGDCLADVFITCDDPDQGRKYFQVWLNAKDDVGFILGQEGRFPGGIGQITFADMDRDGTIDMVFSTCDTVESSTGLGKDCMINIAYNKQLPLCTTSMAGSPTRKCRSPESLCTSDPNFMFNLTESDDNDAFVRIPLPLLSPSHPYLLINDTTHQPPIPLPVRVGDLSLNGFPDLLPVVASSPHGGIIGIGATPDKTPRIFTSIPCRRGIPGCGANGKGRRGFQAMNKGTDVLSQIVDARGVAVLDLDEDGTLDILVQRTGEQGEGTILFVHNNFFYDAFFLKAMDQVLNGPCEWGKCITKNGTDYSGYGVSCPGASYKYTVLDTSGRRSAAQVAQLSQTSYHSLQTPYSFLGLGRTNNYIENLFVGSTKKYDSFINMEGVIPNSKVVIIPSPPGQKSGWKRELFLRPGAWIPWVTLTVVLATMILAIIVGVLHLNEKREDELERRRASHHINFDAL